ncbi:MAG: HAD family hydrolase [Candidatus Hydrogenedentes bacterium]|nr:HAD family hydrolase [Candidatus Hydrogenedentota bacterium]
MDGVLVSGRTIIPGADAFIRRLVDAGVGFLVLTNNPLYTQRDLAHRLQVSGLDIPAENIFTSAMATAKFLRSQKERGTAFVIGESGLTGPIHDIGWVITDHDPEYVVLGETLTYNFEMVTKAIRFVAGGAHFIATNPDPAGPSEAGIVPACGAMASLIESASGMKPFFVGKPNPLMMRTALKHLGVHSDDAVMVGDRMDTDIIAGVQSGLETILVLSGVTSREAIRRYPYQPTRVVGSVAEIVV